MILVRFFNVMFSGELTKRVWFLWMPSQLENNVNAIILIYCYYAASFACFKSFPFDNQEGIGFGGFPKNSSEIHQSCY